MIRAASFLVLVAFAAVAAASAASPTVTDATVFFADGAFSISTGQQNPSGVAFGSFSDGENVNGWGVLNVQTNNASFTDPQRAYAAGYLEGYLTAERILQLKDSIESLKGLSSAQVATLKTWSETQWDFTQTMAAQHGATDKFWYFQGLLVNQTTGLLAGVNAASSTKLTMFDVWVHQATGDLLNLLDALFPEQRPQWEHMDPKKFEAEVLRRSMCSALIRAPYNLKDLYFGHSAWFTYSAMNRVFKTYNLRFSGLPNRAGEIMSFSSYPGFLSSLDDFYQMSTSAGAPGLVMVQTTNNIFNMTLYDLVKPQSLLAWQRVRGANALATNGSEWGTMLAVNHSGTYANDYMVVDMKLFEPGKPLADNLLWVSSEIPGLVTNVDRTDILRRGYFGSYNVPSDQTVYDLSGYPAIVAKYGTGNSYDLAPRAQIFRRDAGSVETFDDFRAIMRYNNYKNDPIAGYTNPYAAICSRGDLAAAPSMGGCYDTKASSFSMHTSGGMATSIINGPTEGKWSGAGNLPPFSWAPFGSLAKHDGQPTVFKYDFMPVQPELAQ